MSNRTNRQQRARMLRDVAGMPYQTALQKVEEWDAGQRASSADSPGGPGEAPAEFAAGARDGGVAGAPEENVRRWQPAGAPLGDDESGAVIGTTGDRPVTLNLRPDFKPDSPAGVLIVGDDESETSALGRSICAQAAQGDTRVIVIDPHGSGGLGPPPLFSLPRGEERIAPPVHTLPFEPGCLDPYRWCAPPVAGDLLLSYLNEFLMEGVPLKDRLALVNALAEDSHERPPSSSAAIETVGNVVSMARQWEDHPLFAAVVAQEGPDVVLQPGITVMPSVPRGYFRVAGMSESDSSVSAATLAWTILLATEALRKTGGVLYIGNFGSAIPSGDPAGRRLVRMLRESRSARIVPVITSWRTLRDGQEFLPRAIVMGMDDGVEALEWCHLFPTADARRVLRRSDPYPWIHRDISGRVGLITGP